MQNQPDLTTGKIFPKLWALSWPMMLSMFFYTLYNLVDAYWVSKISSESIAAVNISQITLFVMMSIAFGITVGSGVIMGMAIGGKNKKEAGRVLGQSFVLTTITGIIFTIIALVFREQFLTASGAIGNIFEPALDYFTIVSAGSILSFILITIMFAFNSQGDTLTLTKLFAVSTAINLILDPLLIFGIGPFPELAISGAATATLISQAAFIVIALRSLSKPERAVPFEFRNLSFQWQSVKQVLSIGVPAAMTQVVHPLGLAALTAISSAAFLEAGATALSLGVRIEFFAYLPAVGFGFGAMAMVAQSIGAKKLERSKEILKSALKHGMFIALVLGIAAFVFAPQIISVFTTDPLVVEYTLSYFRIITLSYCFLAAMMVEASTFQALGRSWPGFWISFLRFAIITIPLSYLFAIHYGFSIDSLWWSLLAGNVISAIVGYFWIIKTINQFKFAEVKEALKNH